MKTHSIEKWLPIPGYEGIYSISDCGSVRREKPAQATRCGFILKPLLDRDGYQLVALWRDGAQSHKTIHGLVLSAFIGLRPPGHVANHINGIKTDNRISNLEWVTGTYNHAHAEARGLLASGERIGSAKLVSSQVLEIRKRYIPRKITIQHLADDYGVSCSAVWQILHQKKWKHLLQAKS